MPISSQITIFFLYFLFLILSVYHHRHRMHATLKTITTSAANLKDSSMSVQSLSQAADFPERVHHQAAWARRKAYVPFPTIDLGERMSVVSKEVVDKGNNTHINSRKRKYSLGFPEGFDASAPTTVDRSAQPFSVAHAESATSHFAASDQRENEFGMQNLFSQPPAVLASPPPTQLAKSLDGIGLPASSDIWRAFPEITSHQKSHIQRTVDCLFRDDLATFLEKHARTWNNSGFWNGPVKNAAASSNFPPESKKTGPTTYLLNMQNESDTYELELRIARVHLFLLLQREILREHRRGTAKKTAKSNAISHLCNSKGLGLAEKTKLHQSFLREKRIGGYWWWCVSFFGPSFLLRCSTKAGKSVSVKLFSTQFFSAFRLTAKRTQHRFPLDAMIAYVLHEYPETLRPHPLDAAAVHLLITGNFPDHCLQHNDVTQVHSTPANLPAIPVWRFFSTEAAEDEAVSFLYRWSSNPENQLLTI